MPSILNALLRRDKNGDLVMLNNQAAQISLPPIMKIAVNGDGNAADTVILPAQQGKAYVIHGYYISATQTAGTACLGVNLMMVDFWDGITKTIDVLALTANQVASPTSKLSGLNVITMPNTPVTLLAQSAAPYWKNGLVYYTEVDV